MFWISVSFVPVHTVPIHYSFMQRMQLYENRTDKVFYSLHLLVQCETFMDPKLSVPVPLALVGGPNLQNVKPVSIAGAKGLTVPILLQTQYGSSAI